MSSKNQIKRGHVDFDTKPSKDSIVLNYRANKTAN